MPKNTSVSLGGHFAEFIERQVAEGRYSSASGAVRAGQYVRGLRRAIPSNTLRRIRGAAVRAKR